VTNITTSSARINWTTNEPADGQLEFLSPCPSSGCWTSLVSVLTLSHAVDVSGLAAGANYTYRIRSRDAFGNLGVSLNQTFTAASPDTVAPVISLISVSNITASSASINWTTNEAADGQIEFVGSCPSGGCLTGLVLTLTLPHTINVSGLNAATPYIYRIRTRDAVGNLALSANQTFTTTANTGAVPTGFWKLDEGSGNSAFDSSGNGITGTLVSEPVWSTGKSGFALTFDGSLDYVDLGNPAALQLTGGMTVAAWVNTRSLARNGRIISKSGGGGLLGWSLNVETYNVFEFSIARDVNTQVWVDSTGGVPLNSWVHVAGVYEPGSAMRIYINGILNNSQTAGIPASQFNAPVNVRIASLADGLNGPCSTCRFDGTIDDVRVYNRALTGTELSQLYASQPPGADTTPPDISAISVTNITTSGASINWTTNEPADGHIEFNAPCPSTGCSTALVSPLTLLHTITVSGLSASSSYTYRIRTRDGAGNLRVSANQVFTTPANTGLGPTGFWKFDEGIGTTALDSSGNGITGTLVNGPVWSPGKSGSALMFNGVTNYVDLGNPAALQLTGAMTAAAWVNTRTLARNGRIIAKSAGGGLLGWSLNVETYNVFEFSIARDVNTQVWVDGIGGVPLNTWVHVAGVYEPGVAMRIYINGTLSNSQTVGIPTSQFNAPVNVQIGSLADGVSGACSNCRFDGTIDDVRIYNRALTTAEVLQLYSGTASSLTLTEAPLFDLSPPDAAVSQPAGDALAILSFRQNDVLVGEAVVPAVHPVTVGRILAEVSDRINTGIAVINPNDRMATVSFFFTDTVGRDYGAGSIVIPPGAQMAQFLSEEPFSSGSMLGTLTFRSSIPVTMFALRSLINGRGEWLTTALPVSELTPPEGETVFPHFVEGDGWTTQFVLINPTDEEISGSLLFDGEAVNGIGSSFSYSIAPRSLYRVRTPGTAGMLQTGSARIVPNGSWKPAGVAIFTYRDNEGIENSEYALASGTAGGEMSLYVESNGPALQTFVAMTNVLPSDVPVDLELLTLDGLTIARGSQVIPGHGYLAKALQEIPGFESVSTSFRGLLRITDKALAVTVAGIRVQQNERQDIVTSMTPATAGPVPQFK
jgi:hypothetical protein